ncbi:hypothetical protein WMY93_024759 [Mugilogobius chulae]|uniref:C2H2-type domain-containing protein n=1 Tax=Mugilogobius chulae TaxID=88201 RepID=A0AAW0NCJ7_9GOBI
MCEKVNIVRALVGERLTAAAEEIFALVERTIVEYEEELCRSKEENQRKQQLLDALLDAQLHTTTAQDSQEDFGRSLKEEKLDQEPAPELQWTQEPSQCFTPNFDYAKTDINFENQPCLKREEQTLLFMNSETASGESVQEWEAPIEEDLSEVETFYREKESDCSETLENFIDLAQSHDTKPKGKKQCAVCKKFFCSKNDLRRHMVVHTGEKPYSCSVCGKRFTRKSTMQNHKAAHSDVSSKAKPAVVQFVARLYQQWET